MEKNSKPISLPVKDFLIRKLSVKHMRSEDEIRSIVMCSFQEANKAMSTQNEVEISGYGKFLFSVPKAKKIYKKMVHCINKYTRDLQNTSPDDTKEISKLMKKVASAEEVIEFIKTRVDVKLFTDNRGVEESSNPTKRVEGINS